MAAVIVAHGLWMPGFETALLRRRLRAAGFAPVLFRFPTVRPTLADNVERLVRFTAAVPGDEVHYVGFSLGGVVAAAMLAERPPARGGRIVCLGSPLNGSQAGRGLSRLGGIGTAILGRSVGELNARGGLPQWPGERDLGVIAGSRSFGVGRLLGALHQPNDGTVAVAETRLEGIADHLIVPVTHTALLVDSEVARQTVQFLRTGHFGGSSAGV